MIEFEQLWALTLLPLPLLLRYLLPSYSSSRTALYMPFFATIQTASGSQVDQAAVILRRQWWQRCLLLSLWSLLLLAAAKPVWMGEPIEIRSPSRDLMVAVDLSGSMAEEDFALVGQPPLSRLEGAKQVLQQFSHEREGDSLGLMVFADAPFLQMPFSQDTKLFRHLLGQSQVRMAGAKTMLGDAIGFAYKHFNNVQAGADVTQSKPQRLLLLVTDGNDSGSKIPPYQAAVLAARLGIKIYPIVLGDPLATGEKAIDEKTLREIAQLSGGRFFRAADKQALEQISTLLNQLEPSKYSISYHRPSHALFYWPLLLALLMSQLGHGSLALYSVWRHRHTHSHDNSADTARSGGGGAG